jgi:glycosyltransferase involved in cell wall biosynthesis
MPRLSAVIITKNEAHNIGACLESVAFCDERIVVDSGSGDDTAAIAHAAGARVLHHDWAGFGAQKSFALAHAAGDWVLSLDADERVTPALAAEITAAIASGRADGYELPRSSTFCGTPIRHCGWNPDYVLRLFRRGSGRFSDDLVHERVICDGAVKRLTQPLIHHTIRSPDDARVKVERYAEAGAAMLLARGRRVAGWQAPARGAIAFLRVYLLKRGFLDGAAGYAVARYHAASTYHRYRKAWRAQSGRATSA